MLLVQAGANGPPAATAGPSARVSCTPAYRVAFVSDLGGLGADGAAYQGVTRAAAAIPCGVSELISSRRPSEYRPNLQRAVQDRANLVIGGSFLLTDALVDAARANRETHFLLIDPLVPPPSLPNLAVLRLRQEESAFLAGAAAAMLTKTGVVAGVYGPAGLIDRQQRTAFERGAAFVRPGIRTLGAYQPPSDGAPYENPSWGRQQAEAFAGQQADVILGGRGQTGAGALAGAARSGRLCIGTDISAALELVAGSCLAGTSTMAIDKAVELEITRMASAPWSSGVISLGLVDGVVGFRIVGVDLRPEIQIRLDAIAQEISVGALATGS